jgi:hypothetical protein
MVYAKFQFAMTKSPFTNKPQSLFVTGGFGSGRSISTAEILTENGWEEFFPSFPAYLQNHCMVLLNSTTAMVVGGQQNTLITADTYLISDDKKVKSDHFLLKKKLDIHSAYVLPSYSQDNILVMNNYLSILNIKKPPMLEKPSANQLP